MKILSVALGWVVFASVGMAGEVSGRASLTMWLENSSDIVTIEVREENGQFLGRSGVGTWGIIDLKWKEGRLVGRSDDGFTDIACIRGECNGQVGSGSVSLDVASDGHSFRGSLNHVYVRAELSPERIEASGDGSLILKCKRSGVWLGGGMLTQDFDSRFSARLQASGTLVDKILNPAFFTAVFLGSFVRNGI
jgi:hypothetical protein